MFSPFFSALAPFPSVNNMIEAKSAKVMSSQTLANIEILYKTSAIHANFNDNFGIFCAGIAFILPDLFNELLGVDMGITKDFTADSAINMTQILIKKFSHSELVIPGFELIMMRNKKASDKIMEMIAEIKSRQNNNH